MASAIALAARASDCAAPCQIRSPEETHVEGTIDYRGEHADTTNGSVTAPAHARWCLEQRAGQSKVSAQGIEPDLLFIKHPAKPKKEKTPMHCAGQKISQGSGNLEHHSMPLNIPRPHPATVYIPETGHHGLWNPRAPLLRIVGLLSPTMATSNTSLTSPSGKPTATSVRAFKVNSKSDWLGPALLAAKTITAGAECVPFPYVKGAFGVIVILLETVEVQYLLVLIDGMFNHRFLQKAKKNRDDLREVCENSTEIMKIVQDQISSHGSTAAEKLKGVCEELESALTKIVDEVQKWQDAPRGFRRQFKEIVKSSSITDKISEYQKKVQTLCSNLKLVAAIDTNFQVHKIHATLTTIAPNLSVTQATQSINDCPPPSRIFHGRQSILAKMHQYFTEDLGKQHIYVLYGLGGSGKTQIALKFIDESASKFSDIFLIDASTPETIDTGLKRIAAMKMIGDTAQDALDWLRSKQNEWLLFFDNADDPKIDLHHFFPRCKYGNILITSRNPQLRGYGSYSLVSDMEEVDAVELLLRSAAHDTTPENKITATEIVKALWYLPLAIVQAGAFILKSGSLNSYLALYIKNKEQLLREKPAQSHDDYAWTVYTTWQISFDQLSKPAAMLLQFCSFLHHGGISEQIFKNASLYRFPTFGPSKQELQLPVKFLSNFLGLNCAWDSLCFWNVTNELQAYSLINFNAARNVFSIHPLVHTWSRNTVADEESYHYCMTALVGMSIDPISEEDIELASLALLPHIGSLFHHEVPTNFRAQYGKMFLNTYNYKKAEQLLVVAVEKYRQVLGEDHVATLDVMGNLAVAYWRLGQYKSAEQLLILVLEKRRKHLGENHPDTLVAMIELACTYDRLGQFKEAAELRTVAVEKRRQILGDEHPSTLLAMNDLALANNRLGQFKTAEEIQIAVLARRRKISGDDHPETLVAMNNLAVVYQNLGQFQKAEQLDIETLEKRRNILGEDHPNTLISMNNLALTYHGLGHFGQCAELQVMVLEKLQKILGDEHPDTLVAMTNLGYTYHYLHMDKEAEKLQSVVLKKRREILGNDHPDTLCAMNHLAKTYHNMSRLTEAEELHIVTFEKRREILGEDHSFTIGSMDNLAIVYHSLERFQEAMELLILVLEKRRKFDGVDHPDTLLSMHNLALVYHSIGQLKDAEELQNAVLEKQKKVLGDDHPDTLHTMTHLAVTYHSLGQFKEAQVLQIAVLEKQRNVLGEDNPDTLLSVNNLAMTYHSLGQSQKAEELQLVALEKRKSLLGEDHRDTMVSMNNLALIYHGLGQFQEAEELHERRKNILETEELQVV
ncbi:hypothetical protein FB451DRAFT_1367085 [Mycena latifolia]|nr:hypothetical protein FB451DRAFT_1367085 [Mycena latifolia]